MKRFEVRKLSGSAQRRFAVKRKVLPGQEVADEGELEAELSADSTKLLAALEDQLAGETMFDRMKKVREHLEAEISGSYFACIVFQTDAQLQAFFKAIGYHGKTDYVSGRRLAKLLAVKLPAGVAWKAVRPDPKLSSLAAPVVKLNDS